MKTLLIQRHGRSKKSDPQLKDKKRPLTASGKTDAQSIGAKLVASALWPDHITSSPAKRARKTAKFDMQGAQQESNIDIEKKLYTGTPDDILNIIRGLDDDSKLPMLIGHDTQLTPLLANLTGQGQIHMPRASVARLEFPIDKWKQLELGRGKLAELIKPGK
jgi:phosphohistidine phosphatase